MRRWRGAEELRAYNREKANRYTERHRDEINRKHREAYAVNPKFHRDRWNRWCAANPEEIIRQNTIKKWRRMGRMLLLKHEFGGKCSECGFEHPIPLQFDHINPSDKVRQVSSYHTLNGMRKEALKCRLLCANCHQIKTWRDRDGTRRVYRETSIRKQYAT